MLGSKQGNYEYMVSGHPSHTNGYISRVMTFPFKTCYWEIKRVLTTEHAIAYLKPIYVVMFLLVSSRAGYLASPGLTWHLGEPHAVASPEQIGPWEAAEKSVAPSVLGPSTQIFLRDRRSHCSLVCYSDHLLFPEAC